ncbi:MAG: hypothetical protein V3V74_06910 [Nitrosomonadaceae bacterium]
MIDAESVTVLETPTAQIIEIEQTIIPEKTSELLDYYQENDNLVQFLDDKQLSEIQDSVSRGFDADEESMASFRRLYKDVMDLATMKWNGGQKDFPFQGASTLMMPYLAQAAIDFNSRIVPEILNQRDVFKVRLFGREQKEKEFRAERVSLAMNAALSQIQDWEENIDIGMYHLAIFGMIFKKTWWYDGVIHQDLLLADQLIFDHKAHSFSKIERKSHIITASYNDYMEKVLTGQWAAVSNEPDEDNYSCEFVETHCLLDIDDDGYLEPYIVIWDKSSSEIVSLVPRYGEDDIVIDDDGVINSIRGEEFFTHYMFIPPADGTVVGKGWGTVLKDSFEALNVHERQLIDAATLNIIAANSGFVNSNALGGANRQQKGTLQMTMAHFEPLQIGQGQKLQDMIYQIPAAGPTQGMLTMKESLKESVTTYTTVSQATQPQAQEAAAMFMARVSEALKVNNAIKKRVFRGLTREAERVFYLLDNYLDDEQYQEMIDWELPQAIQRQYQEAQAQYEKAIAQGMIVEPPMPPSQGFEKDSDFDLDDMDIGPTADPSQGSTEERVSRAMALLEISRDNPLYNAYEVNKRVIEALGVPSMEQVLPEPQPSQPSEMEIMQAQLAQAERERHMMIAQAELLNAETRAKEEARKHDESNHNIALEATKLQSDIENKDADTMKKLNDIDMATALPKADILERKVQEDVEQAIPMQETVEIDETMAMQVPGGDALDIEQAAIVEEQSTP